MAYIYKSVGNVKLEKFIAQLDNVQWEVDSRALEIAERGQDLLRDHRVDDVAHTEVEKDGIDAFAVLVDNYVSNNETKQSNTALSIEFGRAGFIDPDTGEEWGEMEGLFILTQAAHLPKKSGAGSKAKRTKLSKMAFFANAKGRKRKRKRGKVSLGGDA